MLKKGKKNWSKNDHMLWKNSKQNYFKFIHPLQVTVTQRSSTKGVIRSFIPLDRYPST